MGGPYVLNILGTGTLFLDRRLTFWTPAPGSDPMAITSQALGAHVKLATRGV